VKREILFRGRKVNSEEWIEGGILVNEDDVLIFTGDFDYGDFGMSFHEFFEVVPETVGQFIGLNDIDGNKLFEGDKVIIDGVEWVLKTIEEVGYMIGECTIMDNDAKKTGTIHDKREPKIK